MNKTILICDDNEDILEVTSMILEMADYRVLTELNSGHLTKRALKEKPDVLLLDLWMPFLPGDELALAIRQIPELEYLPIIIFSAAIDGQARATKAGVNYFIHKPFNVTELLSIVQTALDN